MNRSTEFRLSGLIVLLALPVHVIGLLMPSIYRDPAALCPRTWGRISSRCASASRCSPPRPWRRGRARSAPACLAAPAAYTAFFVLLTAIGGALAWRYVTAASAA